ncbi:N-acetyltransferase 8-like [Saccoglossus kowalevskii]|uniref:N-acetyltransferase 8-like n=1 Tax=Saccoglossus kowalevskii TaxID=10224 RepID=A0ABM0MEB3_SACKO|nr:PREDICTED: N-acetyltransferase 8-like [Saccoglossus kowalevskii]
MERRSTVTLRQFEENDQRRVIYVFKNSMMDLFKPNYQRHLSYRRFINVFLLALCLYLSLYVYNSVLLCVVIVALIPTAYNISTHIIFKQCIRKRLASDLKDIKTTYIDIDSGSGNFWVAVYDGQIVGTVALFLREFEGRGMQPELTTMYVHRKYRRLGIGTKLMNKAVQYANDHQFSCVFLTTGEDNHEARKLYIKTGFVKIREYVVNYHVLMSTVMTTYVLNLKPVVDDAVTATPDTSSIKQK